MKWMCSNCDYIVEAETPPNACPSCKGKCAFSNVTCYTPECGGEKNIDPQLLDKNIRKKDQK